jgi:site-specific recombinase XerD
LPGGRRIWLGHKNLNTTQIYLGSIPTDRLRDKIDGAFIAHQNLAV